MIREAIVRAKECCPFCAEGVPHRRYGGMRLLYEMHDIPHPTKLFEPCLAAEIWEEVFQGQREWPIL